MAPRSIVFAVLGPVVYAEGWGDVRDGTARRHEGTDIIGVAMQPLLAGRRERSRLAHRRDTHVRGGEWVIDSDGRVTATGEAALVMPARARECAPGPATPFGTDASGWARFESDDLAGTVLDGGRAERCGTKVHDPLLEPLVFTDSASGDRIIVTFDPPAQEPTQRSSSADRWAGSPAAGPGSRRHPRFSMARFRSLRRAV